MNIPQLVFLSGIFAAISFYCFNIYFKDKNTKSANFFRVLSSFIVLFLKIITKLFVILGLASFMSSAKEKYWDDK
jgi:hypothetical protein